ncbi:hypothetical protein [Eisenibacter elegans]|jgi:hypothetical protein|uniref:hypothetical protein n=1 Tax=Eisenibacter elegans TaxID=997 RepID=UPI000414C8D8|nr:hypothetical protein [Eisenibacter elegans]
MRKSPLYLILICLIACLPYTNIQAQDSKEELLEMIIQSMPSPVEISVLIKEIGIEYNGAMLSSVSNLGSYSSGYKQALNLGVYSTDLGYTTIYKKPDALQYLNCVKSLANTLKVGEYINFEAIQRLALSNDLNLLLSETSDSFSKINGHLRENKQSDLAILMLVGGWLETVYLTARVAEKNQNELLNIKIAEQKFVLDQLMTVIEEYGNKEGLKEIVADLKRLQTKLDAAFQMLESKGEVTLDDLDGVINSIVAMRERIIA